jgi:ubiquinone biosynthesis protein
VVEPAPRPFAVARAVLDEAFEGAVAERFAAIEPEPIAAASFGQVHRAWLRDGRMVAVKVQYPGLARRVAADLFLTRVAMRLIRIAMRGFPFNDLASELERASRAELDYLQEAISADRLRPLLADHGIDAPRVVWEHTRSRVLVMQFAEGTTLARLDLAALPYERRIAMAERIVDAYLAMLLDAGFYHADPHAGNFIVGADGRLWLIDFGMTAAVSRREVELYRRFMLHVQRQDIDGMIDVMLRLGFIMPEAEREDLRRLAEELYENLQDAPPQALKGSTRQSDIGWRINEMLRRAEGLVFPQHTVMLSRATGMLEGLCGELVPEVSFLNLVRPLLTRRFTPWTEVKRFVEDAKQLWASLRTLPERMALMRQRANRTAHAVVAGCALLGATHLPEGALRDVAIAASGLAAVMAMIRHDR